MDGGLRGLVGSSTDALHLSRSPRCWRAQSLTVRLAYVPRAQLTTNHINQIAGHQTWDNQVKPQLWDRLPIDYPVTGHVSRAHIVRSPMFVYDQKGTVGVDATLSVVDVRKAQKKGSVQDGRPMSTETALRSAQCVLRRCLIL